MPGHLGIISQSIDTSTNFIEGLALLKYTDQHRIKTAQSTSNITLGIVKNSKEKTIGHYEVEDFEVLLDGELYGTPPQWDQFSSSDEVVTYLEKADGYFSAVIYCKKKKRVFLLTDLFGIKPLYLLENNKMIAWSSEIKTLVKHPSNSSSLDQDAILAYLDLGFLPGSKTWYRDIKLLPAASISVIDIDGQTCSTSRYWSWNKLSSASSQTFSNSIETFKFHLDNAVQKRIFPNETTTVALSGGLDSRALLYSTKTANPLAFTFGHSGSDDVTIAHEVCKAIGITHQVYKYDKSNWLNDKIGSVWRTEGMMPFFHLHSSPFCRDFEKLGDTVFNGFGGATFLGGLFLGKSDKIITQLSKHDDLDYDFYGHEITEAIVIDQHMRRFINQGSIDVGKFLVQRTPFMDRDLVMYLLSLPISHRKNYRLFHQFLRDTWPADLIKIPWENTNFRIDKKWIQELLLSAKWPSIRRILKLGQPAFDYSKLADSTFKLHVAEHYLGPKALVWDALTASKSNQFQKSLFNDLQVTGRLLSLEIWLRLINDQLPVDEGITRF